MLEHERSKAKNSTTKNADDVAMLEFENRKDKSFSVNAKALKHIIKSKIKAMKEGEWKDKEFHSQYPKILEKPHD